MTYNEATEYLYNQRPSFERQGATGYKEGLRNTIILDTHLERPHRHYMTIHVAGTNGKGSCSHTLAAFLQICGYKVGLYTSPHLVDFSERIRVNGIPISQDYVVEFVEREKEFIDSLNASFFEVTTAMAFKYFEEQKVDIAVIEVGLGGRLDCTNIISPILSVITNIGLDHTQFLGDTLAKVAGEKAGIIKSKTPVVIGEYTEDTRKVFEQKAKNENAPIIFADDDNMIESYKIGKDGFIEYNIRNMGMVKGVLSGIYQTKNTNTILHAIIQLGKLGVVSMGSDERSREVVNGEIRKAMMHVNSLTGLRGRWEVIKEHPYVVCDTGHNAHGWTYLSKQIATTPCDKRHIVFSMLEDKDVNAVMKMLPKNAIYYLSQVECQRAMSIEKLAALADEYHLPHKEYNSIWEAYTEAIKAASHNDMVFVGGSSYVVAEFLTKLAQ